MFVFGSFNKKVAHVGPKDVSIDNLVFRLHCKITFWFLLACVVLVGSREFIKEHINCIAPDNLKHVIDTYCFFSSTFTVVKHHNSSNYLGSAHPGVGHYIDGKDTIINHAYYQWVPFVLAVQAILFYMPHYIWKNIENGRLSAIVFSMKTSPLTAPTKLEIKGQIIDSEDIKNKKVLLAKNAYLSLSRFRVNRDWAFYLVLCELLNASNIIFQIAIVNVFLKGQFLDLGIKWFNNSDDALDMVFPKVTKCTFHKYGSSGSIQVHDTICVMGLNIINEKIYCLLWFWLLILLILTATGLIWRLLTFFLHKRSPSFNKFVWGELSPGPALNSKDILVVTSRLSFSDWLFLYYIGRNVNGTEFRRMFELISTSLQKESLDKAKEMYVLLEEATPSQSRKGESFC